MKPARCSSLSNVFICNPRDAEVCGDCDWEIIICDVTAIVLLTTRGAPIWLVAPIWLSLSRAPIWLVSSWTILIVHEYTNLDLISLAEVACWRFVASKEGHFRAELKWKWFSSCCCRSQLQLVVWFFIFTCMLFNIYDVWHCFLGARNSSNVTW